MGKCELNNDTLTDEQKDWFGERLKESNSGQVSAPSHLIKKFRKIVGDENLSSMAIRCYLIDHCYYGSKTRRK